MGILDDAKSLVKIIKEIDNVDLYRKILDLQAEIIELVQENRELKSRIIDLEEKFKIKESLTFKNNAYWIIKDGEEEGPFCSNCWDTSKQLINLVRDAIIRKPMCPNCKNTFLI